ncbi:MAG: hypothetical protein FWF66_04340 [Candidatus Bathyarchaeota archaeon]|nr:hypothetical protein [Candidatus Termiticorpusculum sp.]MCL1970668.1 hypothetical protein [Candidatus Termiticorpusculum sp.]
MQKIFSLILLSLITLSLFTTAFSPVLASELLENSWNTKTPMNQARHGLDVIAVDGKIYAIGGYVAGGFIVDTNERYDPKTDTWSTMMTMPAPKARFAIAACQGKIYCIGGDGPTEVYDIATDSWSTKASLPTSGSKPQAHVVDGKIFVIVSGFLYAYDCDADSWTKMTSLPNDVTSDGNCYSAVVDNQIMVLAYFNEDLSLDL